MTDRHRLLNKWHKQRRDNYSNQAGSAKLRARLSSEPVNDFCWQVHHFTSARQLESSAWICSARR